MIKTKKILDQMNYSDIKYNYFNNWLTDCLCYQQNIVFDKENLEAEKTIYNIKDIDIKFVEYNDYDDDFDIEVWCKIKGKKEWLYLDNIRKSLYERRYE